MENKLQLASFNEDFEIDQLDFCFLDELSELEEESSGRFLDRSFDTNILDEHDPLVSLHHDSSLYYDHNVVDHLSEYPQSNSEQAAENPYSILDHVMNDFDTWWNSNLSILDFTNEPPLNFDNALQVNVTSNDIVSSSVSTGLDEENAAFTRRSKSRPKSSRLELEEIQKYFHLPIVKAAKELRVGVTVLKKRCRELNIERWPHRKIKSLKCLIDNVKELGMTDENEIEILEGHKKELEKVPGLTLTVRTKKLRQACFKANYKKRRLLNTTTSVGSSFSSRLPISLT